MIASSKELKNRTILVACSAKKMVELASGLETMGGTVLPFPIIEAQAIEDAQELDRALASLQDYDWIIFTSAYGVSFFMQRLNESGICAEASSIPKIAAVGPATAEALSEFGYTPALIPKQFVAEGILEALIDYYGSPQHLKGCRVLLPRALKAREWLPEALKAAGAHVDIIPCYRTIRGTIDDAMISKLRESKPDLIVFTSSSTIQNMIALLGQEEGIRLLMESTIAVLGPITGRTAESFGKKAEIVPEENTIASLLGAIGKFYRKESEACNQG
jgi:uroporphyrinogen III methyltransferase/synthase